jgi:DNA-binding response OmpR family regulator
MPTRRFDPQLGNDDPVRVLIVEDELALARSIERGLRQRGFAVDVALDGDAGLDKALVNGYDVVILDRDLPGMHGDDVCRELVRAQTRSRILMLTAAAALDELVDGFGLGVDDYLAKPFQFLELVARVQALARRTVGPANVVLRWGDVEVDPGRSEARRGGLTVMLTPREMAVLEILLRAEGQIVSTETLLDRAWDEHADPFTTSVRVIVSRLRSKLGEPVAIATVVGKGYRLCTAD